MLKPVLFPAPAQTAAAASLELIRHNDVMAHQDMEGNGNWEHPMVQLEKKNQKQACGLEF